MSVQRVAAYVRVSRVMGRAGETFISPDIQMAAIKRWADAIYGADGWVLIETFRDLDESGTSMDRAELNRARSMAESGGFDVLAFYDLSRWARCVADGLAVLQEVEGFGVTVASASESIDMSTAEGELSVTMMLAIHQFRARQAAKSWRETIARQGEQGRHHGRVPTGYLRVNKRLIPDPDLAPVVVEMFTRYADGESAVSIEDDIHSRGLPWMRVSRVVGNPVYVGKVVRRDHDGNARRQKHVRDNAVLSTNTRRTPLTKRDAFSPDDEHVHLHDGQHEPLVSDDLWVRANARREQSQRTNAREWAKGPRHTLAKVAVCDLCDHSLIRQVDKRRGLELLRDSNGRRAKGCPGVGTPHLADLEAWVRGELARLADLWTYDISTAQTSTETTRAAIQQKIDALETKIAKKNQTLVDMLIGRADVVGGDAVYQLAAAKVQSEREALSLRVEELRASLPSTPSLDQARALRSVASKWDDFTVTERNQLLRKWITQVRVSAPAYLGQPVSERSVVVP